MSHGDYPYPADEFDSAAARVAPQGVHRAPRPWRSRWGAFVAVVILFPLLAYGLVTWLSDWDGLGGSTGAVATGTTGTDDPAAGEDPVATDPATDPAATPTSTPTPTPTEPPAPTADLSRPVEVFNATQTSGLAADAAARVEEAGFTSVTPGNWQGQDPPASVVYYATPADSATAQAVATALGIGTVQESAEEAGDHIVVVLASDYSA